MTSEERVAMLEQKLKTLQMFYAAVQADSTLRYGNAGIPAPSLTFPRDKDPRFLLFYICFHNCVFSRLRPSTLIRLYCQ